MKDGLPVMLAVLWNAVVLPNSHDKPGHYTFTLEYRMKLFFDTKSNNKNTTVKSHKKKFAQPILIISPRPDVMTNIVSQLLMHHLADVIPHEADFFTMNDNPAASDAIAVIIVDIDDVDNVELIMQWIMLNLLCRWLRYSSQFRQNRFWWAIMTQSALHMR
ncbi:MAG: hypothetical protein ACR5LF_08390 [Symbiopectobacterium sp.]